MSDVAIGERRFLVLHGWQNRRPREHWQHWLADSLRATGEQVLYPQLPDPELPSLPEWLSILRDELEMLGDGERVVICHSLGCLLWLRHVDGRGRRGGRPRVVGLPARAVGAAGPRLRRSTPRRLTAMPCDATRAAASSWSAPTPTRGARRVRPRSTVARWTCRCTSCRAPVTSRSTRAMGRGRRSSGGRARVALTTPSRAVKPAEQAAGA